MLNINNIVKNHQNIGYKAKKPLLILILALLMSFKASKHPFYISVIDLKQSPQSKTLNLSIKLFTNDFEDALSKLNHYRIDLINPKQKQQTDSLVKQYIEDRFTISVDSKKQQLTYIGYEREEDVIWVYFESEKLKTLKQLSVNTSLLYEYLPQQTIILHADINDVKRSGKINNPDTQINLLF